MGAGYGTEICLLPREHLSADQQLIKYITELIERKTYSNIFQGAGNLFNDRISF